MTMVQWISYIEYIVQSNFWVIYVQSTDGKMCKVPVAQIHNNTLAWDGLCSTCVAQQTDHIDYIAYALNRGFTLHSLYAWYIVYTDNKTPSLLVN